VQIKFKCLHKSHMAELFGPRVFCFSVGQKKVWSSNFGDFVADLKKNFIYDSRQLGDAKFGEPPP